MLTERDIAVAGAWFFAICVFLLIRLVRRGRALCRLFAERSPEAYVEMGSPRPGYFESHRRSAYYRLIMQRKFMDLDDSILQEEFSNLRRSELRSLAFFLTGVAAFGLAFLWLEYGSSAVEGLRWTAQNLPYA